MKKLILIVALVVAYGVSTSNANANVINPEKAKVTVIADSNNQTATPDGKDKVKGDKKTDCEKSCSKAESKECTKSASKECSKSASKECTKSASKECSMAASKECSDKSASSSCCGKDKHQASK